jgi:hypothetical protein
MAMISDPVPSPTPNAGIQKQSHDAASTSNGSTRSCPTRRWA